MNRRRLLQGILATAAIRWLPFPAVEPEVAEDTATTTMIACPVCVAVGIKHWQVDGACPYGDRINIEAVGWIKTWRIDR